MADTHALSRPRTPPRPLRRRALAPPAIILVGASTGGPQALVALVTGLAPLIDRIPVCVTLHLPADLMPLIASHVARTCGVESHVVTGDRRLDPGRVYFAPGDRHMCFARMGSEVGVLLALGTRADLYRPSIDVMFTSGAQSYGARTLGIVLSGMGKDGLEGSRAIVEAGGSVLVQDKTTSAVWGMPGAVANAELAAAILEPAAMARDILGRMGRARRLA